jgi:hypothetical protein
MSRMVTFYDPATGAVQFSSTVQLPLGIDPNTATPAQWEAARVALVEAIGMPCVVGEAAVNHCVVDGAFAVIVPVPPTLDELKTARWAAIKQMRDRLETEGFVYLGNLLQSDARSVLRINTRAQAAREAIDAGQELLTYWKATDNTLMPLDAQQMAAMPGALSEHANHLHTVAGFLLAQIEAAETPEELATIVWPE